jgi:hypothetical protein
MNHRISIPCIEEALNHIPKEEWDQCMQKWIRKREKLIPPSTPQPIKKGMIRKFLYGKGFQTNHESFE